MTCDGCVAYEIQYSESSRSDPENMKTSCDYIYKRIGYYYIYSSNLLPLLLLAGGFAEHDLHYPGPECQQVVFRDEVAGCENPSVAMRTGRRMSRWIYLTSHSHWQRSLERNSSHSSANLPLSRRSPALSRDCCKCRCMGRLQTPSLVYLCEEQPPFGSERRCMC